MKKSKGYIWMSAIALGIILLLGWTVWQNARVFEPIDSVIRSTVMLDGEYSIDGGEWRPIDNDQPINEHFHKAVFKGKWTKNIKSFRVMYVIAKNVWYSIYDSKGELVDRYDLRAEEPVADSPYVGERMLNTPGYYVLLEYLEFESEYEADEEFTLVVEYPYDLQTESFSECFSVLASYNEGIYLSFFFEMLPAIIMFLLICFFGVFFFPIASGLLGRIDFRYIAFGALCFFAGLYMVVDKVGGYMNMWIIDPSVCMMTDKLTLCLFAIAVLIYLRSLLRNKVSKIIMASLITAYFALTLTCVVLHMTNIADMMVTTGIRSMAAIVCGVAATILLITEIRGKKGWALFDYLISWIPLGVFLIIDIIDVYIRMAGSVYLKFGLAITIIDQMVRFGIDFSRQYKEAIRYQQVQRELYEAKVNVMVSQIRPHFMYNALSSIAILCKLNPETAYDATITFSDYLRGNMDSLKQTAPVPFTQELEHLKKYLYIEKLRFADKLNIEYNIQVTDFVLPLLSVQPLVENAVKHGVGMKKKGGTVTISTRETDDAYEVIIQDDGVGFDVNETKDDGRSHIGMENTRKRIKDMCGGDVIIESTVGEGTTAKVILPKEGQNNEDTMR